MQDRHLRDLKLLCNGPEELGYYSKSVPISCNAVFTQPPATDVENDAVPGRITGQEKSFYRKGGVAAA